MHDMTLVTRTIDDCQPVDANQKLACLMAACAAIRIYNRLQAWHSNRCPHPAIVADSSRPIADSHEIRQWGKSVASSVIGVLTVAVLSRPIAQIAICNLPSPDRTLAMAYPKHASHRYGGAHMDDGTQIKLDWATNRNGAAPSRTRL